MINTPLQGASSFPTFIFHDFSITKKWKSTTAGRAVTVNATFSISCRTSNTCHPYCMHCCVRQVYTSTEYWANDIHVFTELLSAVVKITRHYHHFPGLSMIFSRTFQKMVFLNSMTFHAQEAPCKLGHLHSTNEFWACRWNNLIFCRKQVTMYKQR